VQIQQASIRVAARKDCWKVMRYTETGLISKTNFQLVLFKGSLEKQELKMR